MINTSVQSLGKVSKLALAAVGLLAALWVSQASASSHREAPLAAANPSTDLTDVYAWRKGGNVNFVVNTYPGQLPIAGPNWYTFANGARYEIHIDNDGDAVADVTYRWTFSSDYQTDATFLYNTGEVTALDDENLNYRQYYTLQRLTHRANGKVAATKTIVANGQVAPANVGPTSMPAYNALANSAVEEAGAYSVFAGPRDDSFFVALGDVFDLLSLSGADEASDSLAGLNVNSIVLQAPISKLTQDGENASNTAEPVLGIWATVSRQKTSVLRNDGSQRNNGNYVQVSRLGQPLVNEVVIPVGMKDLFNTSVPADDTQFANYVANPELPPLLNAINGLDVPVQGDFGTDDARNDLVTIFLTGVSGLNQPANVVASEQLRLNVSIEPTAAADQERLGVVAGDNAGFPNGRRLGDDVTDIAIQAMAGILHDTLMSSGFEYTSGSVGDNVDENDEDFSSDFPYLAAPHAQ